MVLKGVSKPEWGTGSQGGEWHIDFRPKRPQVFVDALENLRAIFEAIGGKQMRFQLPPEVRT